MHLSVLIAIMFCVYNVRFTSNIFSAHYTLIVFTRFSASHQRLTSPTIHLSAIFHILRFMKSAFHFVPVQETIYILLHFWIIVLILGLHYGNIRSQNGRDHNCITGTSSATISGPRNGGQRSRLELRVFNYGGFCGGQCHSKAYCTRKSRNQCRISGEKQRNQWDAKDYTGTNKGRTWSICCSVGFISLGTRATGTQCYVYKQTTKGHSQRYLKWKEDNQTPGLSNSTMAAVVHFSIWKTCKIHTTYQEIDNDGSVTKCSSVYFNGGIADRRTYLYCRADYVLQSRNQDTRANKVSKSISKHENRTNRNTYKICRSTICHKTSPLLSLPTIWSYCCSVPGKNRKMQHLQWSSSHSTVSNKSSEFSNCNTKMCKLWRGTFSKQQQMSSFTRENADQNEQRNTEVTHYYQQTNTTISYIGRIPYNTDQRQQEENTDRKSIKNRKELCCHFTCTKIRSTGCTFFYEENYQYDSIRI